MQQYMLVVNDDQAMDDIVDAIRKRLQNAGCQVEVIEEPKKLLVVELIGDPLLREATKAKLRKETANGRLTEFSIDKKNVFKDVDNVDFLLPFEKQHVLGALIQRITIGEAIHALQNKLNEQKHQADQNAPLLLTCQRLAIIDFATPVHNPRASSNLWKACRSHLFLPEKAVRDYFGEHVAYYCAWINFYTKCLIVPGIAGGCVFAYNTMNGYTVDTSPYVPFFSFFMVLWSAVFLKLWRRKSTTLAYEWDTLDEEKHETVLPTYTGSIRKSPITDKDELYYPAHYRYVKYCISALISGIFLLVALATMSLSLNLQGYIQPETPYLYIEILSQQARPGGWFDQQSQVMRFVPVVLHVATIQILNRIYKRIATILTDWENHKTPQAYESSLILKRFCFDAFDSYIAIFYLAFAVRDVLKVRLELTSLYMVDCLRRIATELILPVLLQFISKRTTQRNIQQKKQETKDKIHNEEAVKNADLDEYEDFDDYLEMVIAFGYVTMFASAFPFAAFIQIIYNLIEMKSDAYKLCFVVRRPNVVRAKNIGSWQFVLHVQAWLSLFTNMLFFVTNSAHTDWWCIASSSSKASCLCTVVYALEHVLGIMMLLIMRVPSDVPEARCVLARIEEAEILGA